MVPGDGSFLSLQTKYNFIVHCVWSRAIFAIRRAQSGVRAAVTRSQYVHIYPGVVCENGLKW